MVLAVLGLLCAGQSAPVDKCESLTEQLEMQAPDPVRRFYISGLSGLLLISHG